MDRRAGGEWAVGRGGRAVVGRPVGRWGGQAVGGRVGGRSGVVFVEQKAHVKLCSSKSNTAP